MIPQNHVGVEPYANVAAVVRLKKKLVTMALSVTILGLNLIAMMSSTNNDDGDANECDTVGP